MTISELFWLWFSLVSNGIVIKCAYFHEFIMDSGTYAGILKRGFHYRLPVNDCYIRVVYMVSVAGYLYTS